jgi:hypothetical protein
MATPFLKCLLEKTYVHIASRGLIASVTARVIRYMFAFGTADEYNWNHRASGAFLESGPRREAGLNT